ncbi:hypothetical protein WDZ92_54110, partial [Nostoc sp. NIES-2111]
YSAVGTAVNPATPLEAAGRHLPTNLLVPGDPAALLPQFPTRLAGEVQLRGKSHADKVFFLDGRASENDLP